MADDSHLTSHESHLTSHLQNRPPSHLERDQPLGINSIPRFNPTFPVNDIYSPSLEPGAWIDWSNPTT